MRSIVLTVTVLLLAGILAAQTDFDIRAFSDTTKYGWQDWRDRLLVRDDLKQRIEFSTSTEYETGIKEVSLGNLGTWLYFIPGLGQLTSEAETKGSIILGGELLALGASLYFYDRSLYYYDKYLSATQIEDIESYYKAAMNPRQYSMLFLALGAVVWGYNIYDMFQTLDSYNAKKWRQYLDSKAYKPITIGPRGVTVNF